MNKLFLIFLNLLARLLSGGGSLLIQVSVKFDPGRIDKPVGDLERNLIEYRAGKRRRMISRGLIYEGQDLSKPDYPLFRHL
jgi:hypothetical protein